MMTIKGTQAWNDPRTVEVRGWRTLDGDIIETNNPTEIEGFGVYRREDDRLMHVTDFVTFVGALSFARVVADLYERGIV